MLIGQFCRLRRLRQDTILRLIGILVRLLSIRHVRLVPALSLLPICRDGVCLRLFLLLRLPVASSTCLLLPGRGAQHAQLFLDGSQSLLAIFKARLRFCGFVLRLLHILSCLLDLEHQLRFLFRQLFARFLPFAGRSIQLNHIRHFSPCPFVHVSVRRTLLSLRIAGLIRLKTPRSLSFSPTISSTGCNTGRSRNNRTGTASLNHFLDESMQYRADISTFKEGKNYGNDGKTGGTPLVGAPHSRYHRDSLRHSGLDLAGYYRDCACLTFWRLCAGGWHFLGHRGHWRARTQ